MILEEVHIEGFRILDALKLQAAPGFNLIAGPNGVGKTSVLEAIQCLSTGHSFRSRRAREMISHGAERFVISARLKDPRLDRNHQIGLSRQRDGSTELRLDLEPLRSIAPMSRLLPIKAMTPDSHVLIQEGPEQRRQFIDWACFHEFEPFHVQWRAYRRALNQRNETLRTQRADHEVQAWNAVLGEHGTALDQMRRQWLERLQVVLIEELESLGGAGEYKFQFRSGWNDAHALTEILERHLELHRRMRTTTDGPHRAELVIQCNGHPARELLSRGQQKILVYALHLAQLRLLRQATERQAVVLCDDLAAELDAEHQRLLLSRLETLGNQVFLTAVSDGSTPELLQRHFHMRELRIHS